MDGAASFYAAAVPHGPRPLKVLSWNTGPMVDSGGTIVKKLKVAGVADEPPRGFDVILLQELSGQWCHPLTEDGVKDLLRPVSPSY